GMPRHCVKVPCTTRSRAGGGLREGQDVNAAAGGVLGNRRAAAADGTLQMVAVGGFDRAEGELGAHAAAARRGIYRSTRAPGKQESDPAAGGREADAPIRSHFRSYAAAGSASLDSAVVVLEPDAAAGGMQVEIAGRIRDLYASAGGGQLRRSVEAFRLDAAAGGMYAHGAGDILDMDAAA